MLKKVEESEVRKMMDDVMRFCVITPNRTNIALSAGNKQINSSTVVVQYDTRILCFSTEGLMYIGARRGEDR